MEKNFKKFISLTLILSFVFSPYLISVNTVSAQATTSSYGTTGSYGANGSYNYGSSFNVGGNVSGYLTGLAPTIANLPLCRDKLEGSVKKLFRKNRIGGAIAEQTEKIADDPDVTVTILNNAGAQKELEKSLENAINVQESVEVSDPNTLKSLEEVKKAQQVQAESTKKIEENDTCLKSIGRLLIKQVIKQITLSTVEWINTGAEGNPFFIDKPGIFWKQVAENEVLQFGYEISDETKFPFGKDFMRQRVKSIQNSFAQNAEYSLGSLIQKTTPEFTDVDFKADFSAGGWAAWTFLTQIPANNPLGFSIMADNELSSRLEGTQVNAALEIRQTLAQTGGFLNDVRCANPKGLSREAHQEAIEANDRDPATGEVKGTCKRWEVVTPGLLIAEAATSTMKSDKDSLLQVDDLNGAVAAILDAFFSKFAGNIATNGYSGGFSGDFGYNTGGGLDVFGGKSQTENDFESYQRRSAWIQNNPDFNIRTDLTQALIDEQRTYKEKLEEQNATLYDLNKVIFQADYCIPGPHSGWENDSREALEQAIRAIPSKTAVDFENIERDQLFNLAKTAAVTVYSTVASVVIGAKLGTLLGTAVPGLGNVVGAAVGALVGLLVGVAIDFIQDFFTSDGEKLELYYSYIFANMTAVTISKGSGGENGPGITSKEDVAFALESMLERYIKIIHKYYIPEWLPPVADEVAKKFRQVEGYFGIMQDNSNKSVLMDGIIKRLGALKENIDNLNEKYGVTPQKTIPTNQDDYEEELKPFIAEFALIAKNLITGDDIAEVDSLTKQARSEIKYVYEDLLTGEYGCEKYIENGNLQKNIKYIEEKDLEGGNKQALWTLYTTRRGEYPFELFYDYNLLKDGDTIPVPEDLVSKYGLKRPNNKMPVYAGLPVNAGPGFLSNVIYDNSNDKECKLEMSRQNYWLDCLKISDLFNDVDKQVKPVTQNLPNYPSREGGDYAYPGLSFEKAIGVY